MVGIVIVSHSQRLAEGVVELARQMAGPDVPIIAAGGLREPAGAIGTDIALIGEALDAADQGDGVLVLMDLGSAILSTEMARDMLGGDALDRILLCEAPLAEGAIAAAVQSRLGAPLARVAAEARSALIPKQTQLGVAPDMPVATAVDDLAARHSLTLTVHNKLGLHARPAARFVGTVGGFKADVSLTNDTTGRGPVSALSINGVTTLGVRAGHTITLRASGPQAEEALAAVQRLADNNFGDPLDDVTAESPTPVDTASSDVEAGPAALLTDNQPHAGIAAGPGLALGPVRRFSAARLVPSAEAASSPEAEIARLTEALAGARRRIEASRKAVLAHGDRQSAEIFDAHLLFLDDPALRTPAERAIQERCANAGQAWHSAAQALAAEYRGLDDAYLRARAADVEDVDQQVLAALSGQDLRPTLAGPGILVADDLTPAETAGLDPAVVQGIATAFGGPTSHSAILARSLGIPAVVGLGTGLRALADGSLLLLDGDAGRIVPAPDEATQAEALERQRAAAQVAATARAAAKEAAVTRDGRRIEIVANVGSEADARAAVAAGAEGVGLFRTEFLFLDRETAPSEDEQYTAYRAVCAAMQGRPVIIRTLDVGGDKPLAYVDMGHEANPFLGWRAVRVGLDQPEFFKVQLRAIARVAAEFPVRVMFPMIATPDEFVRARALLGESIREVGATASIPTGIMVEIPSAAVRARQFAALVDFFSVGTNDLTQYTLAAERGNARVARLADAFQPAVLELIGQTARAAAERGIWAGVCGELAGDPLAVEMLVGLGITELSMSAPAIPRAKQIVRGLAFDSARARAEHALTLSSPEAIRAYLQQSPE